MARNLGACTRHILFRPANDYAIAVAASQDPELVVHLAGGGSGSRGGGGGSSGVGSHLLAA